jgi:hypothetical protein
MLAAFAARLMFLPWQASAVLLVAGLIDLGFLIQSRRPKRALEARIPALKPLG